MRDRMPLVPMAFPQIAISIARIERRISNRNSRRLGRRVDAFVFTIVPRIGTRSFFYFKALWAQRAHSFAQADPAGRRQHPDLRLHQSDPD
jgi:hypothetical protein